MGTNAEIVLLQRAMDRLTSTHYAQGPNSSGLSTAYNVAGFAITGTSTDSNPRQEEAIPDMDCLLQVLGAALSTIAGGAVSITWFVALESDGDEAITPEITSSILLKPGSVIDGHLTASFQAGGLPFIRPAPGGSYIGTSGTLYLFAKTDAGTVNIVYPRLSFTAKTIASESTR